MLIKFITKISDFFIHTNLIIATAGYALTLNSYALCQIPQHKLYSEFVFCAIVVFYGIHGVIKASNRDSLQQMHPRAHWIKRNPAITLVTLLIFTMYGLWILGKFDLRFIIMIALLSIISLTYILPVIRINGVYYSVRDIPYLKPFFISLIFTIITTTIAVYNKVDMVLLLNISIYQFLFILAVTIPFDIRDKEYDRTQITTIPLSIGVKNSLFVCIMLFVAHGFFGYYLGGFIIKYSIALSIVDILGILTLVPVFHKIPRWYYSVFLEGLWILQFVVLR